MTKKTLNWDFEELDMTQRGSLSNAKYVIDFDLKDIKIKQYNKDKTGFIITDMDGSSKEELFKKKVCDKCGQEIKEIK